MYANKTLLVNDLLFHTVHNFVRSTVSAYSAHVHKFFVCYLITRFRIYFQFKLLKLLSFVKDPNHENNLNDSKQLWKEIFCLVCADYLLVAFGNIVHMVRHFNSVELVSLFLHCRSKLCQIIKLFCPTVYLSEYRTEKYLNTVFLDAAQSKPK